MRLKLCDFGFNSPTVLDLGYFSLNVKVQGPVSLTTWPIFRARFLLSCSGLTGHTQWFLKSTLILLFSIGVVPPVHLRI